MNVNAYEAVISGGVGNSAYGVGDTVGGGLDNIVAAEAATVGGGSRNIARYYAAVAGGDWNKATNYAAIGGGYNNVASGAYSAVPGGWQNLASGNYSLASGANAKALHAGCFVWSDSISTGIQSTAPNQFVVGASAGVVLVGSTKLGLGLVPSAYQLQLSSDSAAKPNGGSWANSSDARIKKNIQPLTGALNKLIQLRGVTYEWINPEDHANQTNVQSGFLAQEVERVFPDWVVQVPGGDHDKALSADGNIRSLSLPFAYDALVVEAIKEQQSQINEQRAELKARETEVLELKQEVARLGQVEQRLAALERLLSQSTDK